MAKSTHVHKLRRLRYKSGNIIFFCCLPDCTYKTNIALALGKRSICHRCGEEFFLSEYSLRLAKPHCDSCHKPKNGDGPEWNKSTADLSHIKSDIKETFELDDKPPSFPENRELKQGEIPQEMTLAERIRQTIHKAQEQDEEI